MVPVNPTTKSKVCSIEGCGGKVLARGWCSKHWARWSKHGDPHVNLIPNRGKGKDPVAKRKAKARYREKNREALRAKGRVYSKKNRSRSNERRKRDKEKEPLKYVAWNRRYYAGHKAEVRDRATKWRHANPERARENVRRRRERVGQKKRFLSRREWSDLLEWFGHRCAYCLVAGKLEPDHVEPIISGGPACRSCNASKSDRPLIVWTYFKTATLVA